MANEAKQKIINLLTDLYKTNGYVTEDEVFEYASNESLSLFDINSITEHLLSHGVIISEEKEKITTKKGRGYRRDHTKFFKEISKEYKGLKSFISYYSSIDGLAEGEWITLIQQARHGNEWARTRLFDTSMQKTIKQAYAVSKKFDLDFEDTLQASSFGILYAISAFDETENSSFPSYVPLAVNSQLRRDVYLYSNPVIDFPTYLMNDFFKIHTLVKEHSCSECAYSNNKLTCENLRNEIQDKLKSTTEEVDECIKYLQPVEDLWEDTGIDDSDVTKGLHENEMKITVTKLLSHLKPQEEEVIRMRFGIDNEEYSLESIAQIKSVTRQRIQQVEAKALDKLRQLARYVLKVERP